MKVGITTYHRALNYGAVLQAYALQKVVSDMMPEHSDCCLLDYHCEKIEDMRCLIHHDKRAFKDLAKAPFRAMGLKKKIRAYDDFTKKYLHVYPAEKKNLDTLENLFDVFITGSDQLWNYAICGDDDTYFLDFVHMPGKKYSYAVSLGMQKQFLSNRERIINNIKDFTCISLREPICIDYMGEQREKIRVDVDPTLLLDGQAWENSFELSNKYGDYILVYCVAPQKEIYALAKTLSRRENLPVIVLTEKITDRVRHPEFRFLFGSDPCEFLSLIKNAKYVLTTSFHATVFGLKFHKRIYAEVNNLSGHNDRIHSLVHMLKAEKCIDKAILDEGQELTRAQWAAVDEATVLLREKSLSYLKSIVQD